MNKAQLIDAVAAKTGVSKQEATDSVNAVIDAISESLQNGNDVNVFGFGIFKLKHRDARVGRNPKTGESINIGASTSVGFKMSSTLKSSLN